tara:strand:- start:789 stop:2807 length:2019 start_codon:yes stop_codon:yes gene_type:complete
MSNIEIAIKARDREIRRLTKETDKLKTSLGGLGPAAKIAAGALGAIGLVNLGRSVIGTIRKFEDLRATLVTIEGSLEAAGQSFDLIRRFTAGTAFQLEEVTTAFITFRNAGLIPTTEFMTNVGNIAAGMNVRIDSVARAIFNATTGEFEMLKQLGIKVKTEGEKLTVTFRGTSQQIDNDGRAIVDLLNEIGKTDFEGAIDRQLKTLTGALSNLQDQFSEVANAIGEGGLTDAITLVTHDLISFTDENRSAAHALGETLGNAIIFVRDNLDTLKAVLAGLGISVAIIQFGKLATGILALRGAVVGLTLAMAANPLTAAFVAATFAGVVFFKDELLALIDVTEDATDATKQSTDTTQKDIDAAREAAAAKLKEKMAREQALKAAKKEAEEKKKLFEKQRKQVEEILLLNETELEQFARKEAEKNQLLNESLDSGAISYEKYLRGINELEEFYAGKRQALADKERQEEEQAAQDAKKAEEEKKKKALDTIQGIRQGDLEFYKNREVLEKNAAAVTIAQAKSTIDTLATQNETFFNIQKAIKISEAIQNTYLAATRALTSLPPPFNFAAAALVTASGFAQVNAIRSQQFPGREEGGLVQRGRGYIVGEGGPELFVPGQTGSIVPNGAAMGGQITVNFNIQAIDTSDFDDLLVTRQDMIVSLINKAMRERGKRAITV